MSEPTRGAVDEFLSAGFDKLGKFIVARPVLVLVTILAITVGLGAFVPSLRLNNDGRVFFLEDDPMLVAQDKFEAVFGTEQVVMFFLESDDLFTPEGYEIVDRLLKALHGMEYKGKPAFSGILDPFHAPALKPGTGQIAIGPILEEENPTPEDIARAKALVTTHPVYSRSIVNKDGNVGAIIATMQPILEDWAYTTYIATEVMRLHDELPGLDKLNARLVGPPVFSAEMNVVTIRESVIYGTASVLMCIFVLFFMFRRFRQVGAAIGTVVFSTIWTLGIMAATGTEMSLIHAILPPAIIVTGLGSAIHVVNEYRLLHAHLGRQEAIAEAVCAMGGPCFLTALTTGIGFLAMLAAPVHPMRTLGLFIALGVQLSFVLALMFVPAVLALGTKPGEAPAPDEGFRKTSDQFFTNLADRVVQNKRGVALFFALLAVAFSAGLIHIEFDTNFLHALRSDHPFRQTVEYVDEKMGGSSSMELVIDTGVKNGVYDAEFLARLNKLQRWVETNESDVVWVTLSIADLMREINLAVTGERVLPKTDAQAAELMFLYEVGGGITRNMLDHEKRRVRMSARTRSISSQRSEQLEHDLRTKAEELFGDYRIKLDLNKGDAPPPPPPDTPAPTPASDDDGDIIIIDDDEPTGDGPNDPTPEDTADGDIIIIDDEEPSPTAEKTPRHDPTPAETAPDAGAPAPPAANGEGPLPTIEIAGSTPLFAKLNDYVIDSQLKSFLLAAVIIGFIMMFMLRSPRLGMAIMIPNVLPIFSTYGLMGWLGVSVDFMTAVIAVAAIGVAVDGTIHIGTRYRRARAQGDDSNEAARKVMTSVGRALVVTTVGLMCGFIVLAPSIMVTLAIFGVFMAFCLFLALLYDLLMTPAVLAWLSPDGKRPADD